MIKNMAYMIARDLPQSNVSAKTWEGLKYYTERKMPTTSMNCQEIRTIYP